MLDVAILSAVKLKITFLLFPGISLKTQELYIIVFLARYLDLFTRYISFYNTVMKLIFLGTSIAIVWYMRYHKVVKQTYNKDEDTFRHYFLIPPCFVLALLVHRAFSVTEVEDCYALCVLVHCNLICWLINHNSLVNIVKYYSIHFIRRA